MRKKAIGYGCFRYLALSAALLNGAWLTGCGSRIEAQPAPVIPEVATITLRPQRVELTTELPGRTSAYRIAEIRPQVSGIIQKRLFAEGADVKAGAVLYQIDPAPFQVDADHRHFNHIADVDHLKGVSYIPVGHFRNVDQAILLDANVHKSAKVDDVAHSAPQAHSNLQILYLEHVSAQHRRRQVIAGVAAGAGQPIEDVDQGRLTDLEQLGQDGQAQLVAHCLDPAQHVPRPQPGAGQLQQALDYRV